MLLYERIKSRREELGLSQEELAHRIGYKDRSSIAKIESGVNDITQSKIKAIADALDTTPSYLMGWEESPSVSNKKNADPKAGGGESLEDIIPGYDSLTEENKDRLRDYAALLLAAQQNQ